MACPSTIIDHGNANKTSSEFSELKDLTTTLNFKVKDMQKNMDNMQISINEKEAEIIRLTMCLGDEKKKNNDL